MMKTQNKKRGFTIIELVIVVSVIAILSAVMIPTFAGIIKKANRSADEQATYQMNKAITAVADDELSFADAIKALDDAGYNSLDNLTPVSKGYAFYWDAANKTIVLVNTKDNTVVFPKNYETEFQADWKAFDEEAIISNLSNINVASKADISNAIANGAKKVTLTKDLKLTDSLTVENDLVIDLNGYELNATKIAGRPFSVDGDVSLTIDATGAEVNVGKYGLVNVALGSNATVVINGGTYNASSESNNGAFIKVRCDANNPSSTTANITLNNVTYVDNTNQNFILNCTSDNGDEAAPVALTVNGGSYKAKAGFQATENSTFTNVTIETTAVALEVSGENVTTITGCTLTAGSAQVGSAPAGAIAVSSEATATIEDCTINAVTAYYIYSSGGTIVANGNNLNTWANAATTASASITIDGEKVL